MIIPFEPEISKRKGGQTNKSIASRIFREAPSGKGKNRATDSDIPHPSEDDDTPQDNKEGARKKAIVRKALEKSGGYVTEEDEEEEEVEDDDGNFKMEDLSR